MHGFQIIQQLWKIQVNFEILKLTKATDFPSNLSINNLDTDEFWKRTNISKNAWLQGY